MLESDKNLKRVPSDAGAAADHKQMLFDELPRVIAMAPPEQLVAILVQLAAAQSAIAVRLLTMQDIKPEADKQHYLTVPEVCEQFKVTEHWLYRHKRQLPHSQPTRKLLLFPEEKLRHWFERQKP